MNHSMTYGNASDLLEAVRVLEVHEKAGDITPAEQRALDEFRKQQKPAAEEVAKTRAGYRGMQKGLTFNALDEASGVASFLTGNGYAAGRDAVRQKDMAAQVAFPEDFSSGQTAGGVMSAVLPGLGTLKATAGMGMLGKMAVGGVAGGLMGAAPGFAGGEGGFMPRLKEAVIPGLIGMGVGAAAPVVGKLAGNLVRNGQNMTRSVPGYGSLATQKMAGALAQSPMDEAGIKAYLSTLGPDGMIADIPGSPRRLAQGLAAMPGEGGSNLGAAIEGRATGAGQRIKADANAVIAGPNEAFDKKMALAAERTNVLGPEYEAALAYRDPINPDDLRKVVVAAQKDAAGNVRSALNKLLPELGMTTNMHGKVAYTDITATRLHNARSELSDNIEEARKAGRMKFVAQMTPILKKFDEKLDELPGYAAARTGYANNKAMEKALQDGREVFRGGATSALSPNELKLQITKMSPAQLDAFRKGAREYVDALMGTSRNDAASAWGEFSKGWNDEKLRIILGTADAEKVISRLKAEKVFSATKGDVLAGSQTQMRAEAANNLADLRDADTGRQPGPIKRINRAVGNATNAAIDSVLYGPRRQAANAQLGNMMSLQGAQRDQLLPLLMAEAAKRSQSTRAQNLASGLLDLALKSSIPVLSGTSR